MGAAENRPPEEQDWASKEMQSSCFKQSPVEPVSAGAPDGDAKAAVARHAPKSLQAVTTLLYDHHAPLCHVCCVVGIQLIEEVQTSPVCPPFRLCFAQDST